jgi:hypothetical protein
MANCKYCGRWAGVAGDEHMDCARLAADGKTNEEIKAFDARSSSRLPAMPLTAGSIFWAVFGALWAFAITAGIVGGIIRAIINSAP